VHLTTDMWRSDNVGTVQADFKGVMNFSTHFGHITPWVSRHIFALDSQVVFATIPVNAQKTSPPRHDTSLRFGRQNVPVFYWHKYKRLALPPQPYCVWLTRT